MWWSGNGGMCMWSRSRRFHHKRGPPALRSITSSVQCCNNRVTEPTAARALLTEICGSERHHVG